jgi:hypothetical protein
MVLPEVPVLLVLVLYLLVVVDRERVMLIPQQVAMVVQPERFLLVQVVVVM